MLSAALSVAGWNAVDGFARTASRNSPIMSLSDAASTSAASLALAEVGFDLSRFFLAQASPAKGLHLSRVFELQIAHGSTLSPSIEGSG